MHRNNIATGLEAGGIVVTAAGAAMIFAPLGLLVLGVGAVIFGVALERR
jgi:hypothetical protein